jgi:hypothetical protein
MCPSIPENTNFLILKEGSLRVFLEKKSQETIVKLSKGYRLNPLNQTAKKTEESEIGNCKYQVELTSDIKENLPQNITQDKNLPQDKNITQGSFWIEKKYLEDFPNNNFSLEFLLSLILSIIQILIAIVLFILLRDINANQKQSVQKMKDVINQSYNQLLNQIVIKYDNQLNSYYQYSKDKFKRVLDEIIELKEINLSALSVPKSSLTSTPVKNDFSVGINNNLEDSNIILPSQNHDAMLIVDQRLDEIITNFNLHNKAYFNGSQFQPLNPSKVSSQGYLEEDGSRMIQLEILNDVTQAIFLKFLLDQDNWLIPNLASPHTGNIHTILDEYPEIFSIISGTNKLTLTKPAKLKTTETELWEIEEPGEFTQQ